VTWTHNQALMELGALVCTARVARCASCPVRSVCATQQENVEGAGSAPGRHRRARTTI
jgi:A/G-specific adenine glycosylase